MANKTITLISKLYAGTTGMLLYLEDFTTGNVMNTAEGDLLTETGDGFFSATVTEAITGWFRVTVKSSTGSPLLEGGTVRIESDVVGVYPVDYPTHLTQAVEDQLADDFAAITETIDSETISQLVFQSIVGSGLAKYSIPQVTGTIEAVKYADLELSISASTASDSILYLSIGCENHTTPNLQADSTDGLTILNQLEDFDPADVTVQRTSPTVVDVWISARVLSKLSAADYLIALTEITTDNKTKLRFEKHFTIRSGAGRIIG